MQIERALADAVALSRALAAAGCVDSACKVILEDLRVLLRAQRAAVVLQEGGRARARGGVGVSPAFLSAAESFWPWTPPGIDPEPIVAPDLGRHPALAALREPLLAEGATSGLLIPLRHDAALLGCFAVLFDERHEAQDAHVLLCQLVAAQLGAAITRFTADRAAQEAHDHLKAVLDTVPDGIVVFADDSEVLYANEAVGTLGGRTASELIGTRTGEAQPFDVFDESYRPIPPSELPHMVALRGAPVNRVIGFRPQAGGPTRWNRIHAQATAGGPGRRRFAVAVVHDVTRSRRDADARHFLLEAGSILGSSLDYQATLKSVASLAVQRLSGWCSVSILGDDGIVRPLAIAHGDPDQLALVDQLLREYPEDPEHPSGATLVVRTGQVQVFNDISDEMLVAGARDARHLELLRKLRLTAGMAVPLSVRGRVVGALSFGSAEHGYDEEDQVVARKLADRAAMAVDNARLYAEADAARRRLALAMESGRMGNWEYEIQAARFHWSDAVARLQGVPVADLLPTLEGYLLSIHPLDRDAVRAALERAIEQRSYYSREYRLHTPSGETRWVESRAQVECGPDGQPVRLVGMRVDISERKFAEEALAGERERLKVTLASIGDAVVATDPNGCITMLNGIAEDLTGWSMDEAVGHPLAEVFHIVSERTGLPVENPVQKVLQTGKIVGLANHSELIARDGRRRGIADSAAPIRAADGSFVGVVLVFRDVTQEQHLEREVAKANKLESLGVLAGGIAHDFNNILTAISANVSLARRRSAEQPLVQNSLVAAEAACARAADLTRQLLTFARGGAPSKVATSLSAVVREACGFALQGSAVKPEYDLPDTLWPIEADAGQIGQVVHNLALNAAQAMEGGGILRVSAANVEVDDTLGLPLVAGRYVRLQMADQGPGIPPEVVSRVFDPFFTTKAQGTGLGLSTAFSIIHRHDGHISLQSTVGSGTTFVVHLPAAAAAVAAPDLPGPVPRGRGRVLVMDDDPYIREIAQHCLTELGYECETVGDGDAVLRAYEAAAVAGRPFDVVSLDLTVVGGMGGREALRRLRALYPDVRAIVSSGYFNDPVMAKFREEGFLGAIHKPFRVDDLGRVLDEILRRG